jgi:hypothetical protein
LDSSIGNGSAPPSSWLACFGSRDATDEILETQARDYLRALCTILAKRDQRSKADWRSIADGMLSRAEGTQHTVLIREGLWLADTACTQTLWRAVMARNLRSRLMLEVTSRAFSAATMEQRARSLSHARAPICHSFRIHRQ